MDACVSASLQQVPFEPTRECNGDPLPSEYTISFFQTCEVNGKVIPPLPTKLRKAPDHSRRQLRRGRGGRGGQQPSTPTHAADRTPTDKRQQVRSQGGFTATDLCTVPRGRVSELRESAEDANGMLQPGGASWLRVP